MLLSPRELLCVYWPNKKLTFVWLLAITVRSTSLARRSFERGWSPERMLWFVVAVTGGCAGYCSCSCIDPELSSTTNTFGRTFSSRTSSGSRP